MNMDAPPIIATARPRATWWLVVALLATAVAGVVFYLFNPSQYNFYPRCAMYTLTGLYCPGCGSQRALYYLVHGHLAAALRCNLLLMLSLPFAAVYAARWAVRWVTGEALPRFAPSNRAILLFGAVLVVFTILRNIHLAPFIYLAPP